MTIHLPSPLHKYSNTRTGLSTSLPRCRSGAVLLTGGTGFVGTLIAAVLLGREHRRVVALVREGWQLADLVAKILPEMDPFADPLDEAEIFERLTILPLPATCDLDTKLQELRRLDITEIVHCAGSVDYLNAAELEQTNVLLTDGMLDLARALQVERFIHISTAYSSGYSAGPIAERLHAEPAGDPTDYTRTKRTAERHVLQSDIPSLIIRPSVVIGDSRTGRYSGKRTGIYQYWHGWERLLLDHHHDDFHVVAPRLPVNFVHQDALQNAFQAAYRHSAPQTIFHLVSDPAKAPTSRALWEMWLAALGTPHRPRYYDRLMDVPLDRIPPRQRAFLMLASVNMEISAHRWDFEDDTMTTLKQSGLDFADATLETMALCQARFMDESPRLRAAMAQTAGDEAPRIFA